MANESVLIALKLRLDRSAFQQEAVAAASILRNAFSGVPILSTDALSSLEKKFERAADRSRQIKNNLQAASSHFSVGKTQASGYRRAGTPYQGSGPFTPLASQLAKVSGRPLSAPMATFGASVSNVLPGASKRLPKHLSDLRNAFSGVPILSTDALSSLEKKFERAADHSRQIKNNLQAASSHFSVGKTQASGYRKAGTSYRGYGPPTSLASQLDKVSGHSLFAPMAKFGASVSNVLQGASKRLPKHPSEGVLNGIRKSLGGLGVIGAAIGAAIGLALAPYTTSKTLLTQVGASELEGRGARLDAFRRRQVGGGGLLRQSAVNASRFVVGDPYNQVKSAMDLMRVRFTVGGNALANDLMKAGEGNPVNREYNQLSAFKSAYGRDKRLLRAQGVPANDVDRRAKSLVRDQAMLSGNQNLLGALGAVLSGGVSLETYKKATRAGRVSSATLQKAGETVSTFAPKIALLEATTLKVGAVTGAVISKSVNAVSRPTGDSLPEGVATSLVEAGFKVLSGALTEGLQSLGHLGSFRHPGAH